MTGIHVGNHGATARRSGDCDRCRPWRASAKAGRPWQASVARGGKTVPSHAKSGGCQAMRRLNLKSGLVCRGRPSPARAPEYRSRWEASGRRHRRPH